MKDGFWGNYATGKYFLIDEHEKWLRRPGNAETLGISGEVIKEFGRFANRETLLPFVYRNAPVMRWRCHGEGVTFEFDSDSWDAPLRLMRAWGNHYAGPFLHVKAVNFRTMESRCALWQNFDALK